jgi:hypothetical protein
VRSVPYGSKQPARQKAIRLSEDLGAPAFVAAREGGALVLYATSTKDASGWRCVRGGLERPLGRRELAERYLLKPGSKLRLSPLGA